ncbi:zinc finger protein 121-like [Ruditapes philippinarum]|uniref:zinc finger protein 121-like n=1 Tax=Ruditapes philippinarum TaxID=129788 RepID=UPI00295AD4D5|nr:zinc finger protein 121-like [Ruditapes philippinarum]
MPKTFLIRKKQGLKNVWCAPEAEVFGHIDYRNSDESFRTGFPVTLNISTHELPSPLAADGPEREPTSSEPVSRDHIRSAFEYWPAVKQRLLQSPPHNAFPQRPNILPFGFQYYQTDKIIHADLNNNSNNRDRLIASSPPFSPNSPAQTNAFIPRDKDSDLLASSPLGACTTNLDSFLWHAHNFYNNNYPGFEYNLCQRRLSQSLHPYKVPEKTVVDWPFGCLNKLTKDHSSLKSSPTLPETQNKPLNVPKSPLVTPSAAQNIELINGGYGIKNPLLSPECNIVKDTPTPGIVTNCTSYRDTKFSCKICGKCFEFPKLLQRHLKTHSDVKRYLCTFCGKGFNDTFDLKRHTRTHTGVRPYKCDMCDKAFTQRCSLESHCRKIHNVEFRFGYKERRGKVYVCEDCGHVTNDPEEHFVHIKDSHPYNPTILRCYDKRHFKFNDDNIQKIKNS